VTFAGARNTAIPITQNANGYANAEVGHHPAGASVDPGPKAGAGAAAASQLLFQLYAIWPPSDCKWGLSACVRVLN